MPCLLNNFQFRSQYLFMHLLRGGNWGYLSSLPTMISTGIFISCNWVQVSLRSAKACSVLESDCFGVLVIISFTVAITFFFFVKDPGEKSFFILSSAYCSTPFSLIRIIAIHLFSFISGVSAIHCVSFKISPSKRSGYFKTAFTAIYPPRDKPHRIDF